MDALVAAAGAAAALPPLAPPLAPPSPQRLSEEQRWSCVALHKDGRSWRYIAQHLGVNKNSVQAVLARFAATGSPGSGSRSGRPRCTDEALDTAIAVTSRLEPFTPPKGIRRKLNLDISPRTIDRRLQEAGLFGRVARHKPDYTPAQRQKRLAFAEGYGNWTTDDWDKVLFSDEKTFFGEGFNGNVYVRRPPGREAFNPEYCVIRKAHPVKIGVWACFTSNGQGFIALYEDNLDKELYRKILSDLLLPSVKLHISFDPPEQWYFQQDNAPAHKSKLVTEFLHGKGITCLDHPPYSPDLNPIENLWAIMAREVEKEETNTVEKLRKAIGAAWGSLSKEAMRNIVHSMPKRCADVIAAKGWHTKY